MLSINQYFDLYMVLALGQVFKIKKLSRIKEKIERERERERERETIYKFLIL